MKESILIRSEQSSFHEPDGSLCCNGHSSHRSNDESRNIIISGSHQPAREAQLLSGARSCELGHTPQLHGLNEKLTRRDWGQVTEATQKHLANCEGRWLGDCQGHKESESDQL